MAGEDQEKEPETYEPRKRRLHIYDDSLPLLLKPIQEAYKAKDGTTSIYSIEVRLSKFKDLMAYSIFITQDRGKGFHDALFDRIGIEDHKNLHIFAENAAMLDLASYHSFEDRNKELKSLVSDINEHFDAFVKDLNYKKGVLNQKKFYAWKP